MTTNSNYDIEINETVFNDMVVWESKNEPKTYWITFKRINFDIDLIERFDGVVISNLVGFYDEVTRGKFIMMHRLTK